MTTRKRKSRPASRCHSKPVKPSSDAKLAADAFALHQAGNGLSEIAQKLGISVMDAYGCVIGKIVRDEKESPKSDEQLRSEEFAITALLLNMAIRHLADGEPGAIKSLVAVLERRAKYRGLDTLDSAQCREALSALLRVINITDQS